MNQETVNFVKPEGFDIKKLILCNPETNLKHRFQTMKVKYKYSDEIIDNLCIRTPSLFSYGIKAYNDNDPSEYFMSLLSFYDCEDPQPKETKFKETIESITNFLTEKAPKKYGKKKTNFNDLEIFVDGDKNPIFFPKLKHIKNYNKSVLESISITTNFYRKPNHNDKKEDVEENGLVKIDPLSFTKRPCKVVAFVDIEDIFITSSKVKVRTSLSFVIINKKDVQPPRRVKKETQHTSFMGGLGSDDESDNESESNNEKEEDD